MIDKIKWIHENISFEEEKHIYTRDGKQYDSVTSLLSTYSSFDKEVISIRTAKKQGCSQKEILDLWEEIAQKGTDIHKFAEEVIQGKKPDLIRIYSSECRQVLKVIAYLKTKYVHLIPEVRVWNSYLQMAGTIDLIAITEDGQVDIYDWKTNSKGITDKSWNNLKGILDKVPDSKLHTYSLQLAIYSLMLGFYKIATRDRYLLHISEHDNRIIPCEDMTTFGKAVLIERAKDVIKRG